MKLEGKVALITGGGTGIGKAAAEVIAAEGGVSIVAGRRMGPLEDTVAEITAAGGKALACPTDVTRMEDIEKLRDLIRGKYGRLDILVNNAGSALFKSFLDTSVDDLDRLYQVDLRSVYLVTQNMVPLMRTGGGGSIINVSSILGVLGGKKVSAYCAMKGGVVLLTKALAAELGPHIRVNCLCPSHIITDMMQEEMERIETSGKLEQLNKLFPMKRVGYPEDMKGIILFFAGQDSAWLTGNIFMVDGGLSCYV
jgi:3-oxoacyl-[acyl-carrier protein] reductase